MARLYIFSGLPGVGKTTLARHLATRLSATYIRIDTVEQALRDLYSGEVQGEGYDISYRIAKDNLALGSDVVADSCNPIKLTRKEWERVAHDSGCDYVNIHIICSDPDEHRRRVETRVSTVAGLTMPTWEDVENREYHTWSTPRIYLDTASASEQECLENLLSQLAASSYLINA